MEEKTHYKKGVITPYNINIAQLQNPNVVAWWSAALPGFGHIMLCRYVKGFLLIVWEFVVNVNSRLNSAMVYTFTGQFEEAVEVLNTRWALLYVPLYIFCIWDSRRVTIDLNKYAILADSLSSAQDIEPISFSGLENNYLDERKPWLAVFWSFVTPGLGHMYIGRAPSGFYILIWWVIVLYFSHGLQSILYTFLGDFHLAVAVTDTQWFLFLPSMFGFAAYDAYRQCDAYNKLMGQQQSLYLMKNFQSDCFKTRSTLFSKELIK